MKLKQYRVIGKEYNCVYVTAKSSTPIHQVLKDTEERTGNKIDRLEYVKSFPC